MTQKPPYFEIYAGDDLVIPVQVTDNGNPVAPTDPTVTPGTPVDISNAQKIVLAMFVRDEDHTRALTYTLAGGGIVITDGQNGKYEITVANEDSFGLAGHYDMQSRITDSAGAKMTPFNGVCLVKASYLDIDE